jgi:hypothetical protein
VPLLMTGNITESKHLYLEIRNPYVPLLETAHRHPQVPNEGRTG